MSTEALDAFPKLEGLPPREEDLTLFKRYGVTFHQGDAFAAYGLVVLLRCFEERSDNRSGYPVMPQEEPNVSAQLRRVHPLEEFQVLLPAILTDPDPDGRH